MGKIQITMSEEQAERLSDYLASCRIQLKNIGRNKFGSELDTFLESKRDYGIARDGIIFTRVKDDQD